MPTQHKNAEFILLPQYAKQFESPLLQGILDAMNKHNLDVVMFESAVKVGLQGYFGYIRNGYGLSSSRAI